MPACGRERLAITPRERDAEVTTYVSRYRVDITALATASVGGGHVDRSDMQGVILD
jgi:hypothetical protein